MEEAPGEPADPMLVMVAVAVAIRTSKLLVVPFWQWHPAVPVAVVVAIRQGTPEVMAARVEVRPV